jgi:hypothetical protein
MGNCWAIGESRLQTLGAPRVQNDAEQSSLWASRNGVVLRAQWANAHLQREDVLSCAIQLLLQPGSVRQQLARMARLRIALRHGCGSSCMQLSLRNRPPTWGSNSVKLISQTQAAAAAAAVAAAAAAVARLCQRTAAHAHCFLRQAELLLPLQATSGGSKWNVNPPAGLH